MHVKGGGKIEIGTKGERSYHGTSHATLKAIEEHLAAHPEKHLRSWVGKSQPEPPKPRKRDANPEVAAARAKAKQERQEQREAAVAEKTKAREAKRTERVEKHAKRAAAKAERTKAREEKREAAVAGLKKIGAPVKDGKLDKSKVPGATKDFQPLTSLDPESSYKGRSFKARNSKEMAGELLGASARGGNNEQILRDQLGNLDVKDPVQWEPIAEKYESGPINTFHEAMAVLAKHSADGGVRPDWRNLDLDALRSCPGLSGLEAPGWVQDHQTAQEEQEHLAGLYDAAEHADPATNEPEHDEPVDEREPEAYHPPEDDDPVPFGRA